MGCFCRPSPEHPRDAHDTAEVGFKALHQKYRLGMKIFEIRRFLNTRRPKIEILRYCTIPLAFELVEIQRRHDLFFFSIFQRGPPWGVFVARLLNTLETRMIKPK